MEEPLALHEYVQHIKLPYGWRTSMSKLGEQRALLIFNQEEKTTAFPDGLPIAQIIVMRLSDKNTFYVHKKTEDEDSVSRLVQVVNRYKAWINQVSGGKRKITVHLA